MSHVFAFIAEAGMSVTYFVNVMPLTLRISVCKGAVELVIILPLHCSFGKEMWAFALLVFGLSEV